MADGFNYLEGGEDDQRVQVDLLISPQLNARLDEIASALSLTRPEVFSRACALLDVVFQANTQCMKVGIVDNNNQLVTEFARL